MEISVQPHAPAAVQPHAPAAVLMRKEPQNRLHRNLEGSQRRSWLFGGEKNLFSLLAVQPRLFCCLARSHRHTVWAIPARLVWDGNWLFIPQFSRGFSASSELIRCWYFIFFFQLFYVYLNHLTGMCLPFLFYHYFKCVT